MGKGLKFTEKDYKRVVVKNDEGTTIDDNLEMLEDTLRSQADHPDWWTPDEVKETKKSAKSFTRAALVLKAAAKGEKFGAVDEGPKGLVPTREVDIPAGSLVILKRFGWGDGFNVQIVFIANADESLTMLAMCAVGSGPFSKAGWDTQSMTGWNISDLKDELECSDDAEFLVLKPGEWV